MNTIKYLRKKFKIHRNAVPPYSGQINNNRQNIYQAFAELNFKIGAEIGVYRGGNALRMCRIIQGLELICIDPWLNCRPNMTIQRSENCYQIAIKRLKKFNITWMRMPSRKAYKMIKNQSLDFIYIDGQHDFDNVIMDLINWSPKIKIGGIISGHDYSPVNGVIKAVNAYTFAHGIRNVHITRETNSSFFWANI